MIRLATRSDIPQLINLLRDYAQVSPLPEMREFSDEQYVTNMLDHVIVGAGLAIVAEVNKSIVGMLIAVKNYSAWDSKFITLNELCYWVDPAHRNSTHAYRLLREYIAQARELQTRGYIARFTISKMTNSPDLKYEKLNFNKVEETWVYGGIN